jgi:hypothetical protein
MHVIGFTSSKFAFKRVQQPSVFLWGLHSAPEPDMHKQLSFLERPMHTGQSQYRLVTQQIRPHTGVTAASSYIGVPVERQRQGS